MRVWKEIYLPIVEICNSIALGFIFFLTLKLTPFVPYRDTGMFGGYPELLVVSLAGLVFGYFLQILSERIKAGQVKDIAVLVLLTGLMIWSLVHFSRPILMETIFHSNELLMSLGFTFLLVGFLISGLKEAQMGGFLVGIFLFTIAGLTWEFKSIPFKPTILILLGLSIFNLSFRSFLKLKNQFLPSRRIRRDFKLFSGLYSSFFVLFLVNLAFTSVRGFASFQLSAFLFLISYLGFRTYAIYRMNQSFFRPSIIWGRNLLVINFILFAGSFSWEAFSWLLYFFLGGCLGFFRPENPIYKKRVQTLSIGLVAIIMCLGIIQLAKLQYYWIHLEVFLVFPVFLPFILSYRLEPQSIHLPILIAILLSVFLFKTPVIYSLTVIPKPKIEISQPIPYLLSDIWKDKDKYIFIHSGLPWDEVEGRYPSLEDLHGLVPILGDNESGDSYLNYYRRYLDKNKIPYYLISKNNAGENTDLSILYKNLKYTAYPGFRVYYSEGLDIPSWNTDFGSDKMVDMIGERLQDVEELEDFSPILNSMERYAYGNLKKDLTVFRSLLRDSVHSFCHHYYSNNSYTEALSCFNLMMKFGSLDDESLRKAYTSLDFTTPSYYHLELLERLAEVPEYQVSILKKIYPIQDASKNENQAIQTLEKLISISQKSSHPEEVVYFEQEITRLYLELDKLEKAYPLIQSGLRQDKTSLIWNRLKDVHEEKKEIRRRAWTPPPTVDTTEIE